MCCKSPITRARCHLLAGAPPSLPAIADGGLPPEILHHYLHPAARNAAAVFTREQFVWGDNFPPGSHPAFPCAK